jgi:hypothetical protein
MVHNRGVEGWKNVHVGTEVMLEKDIFDIMGIAYVIRGNINEI